MHRAISTHAILSALQHNEKGMLYAIDKEDFTIFRTTPSDDLKNNLNITKNESKQLYSYRIINNWDKGSIGYRINVDIYPDTYSIYSDENQDFCLYQLL